MAIPDFQSLMLPVLRASAYGQVRIGAVVDQLAEQHQLTPEEKSRPLPSGQQTVFANRVHWAKSYLGKAGLVELTGRGLFQATSLGMDVLAKNPERIDIRYLGQFESFRVFKDQTVASTESSAPAQPVVGESHQTPDDIMREAQREIEKALAQDLLDRLRRAPPDFFERTMVSLLLSMGFGGSQADQPGRVLGRSGDDGVIDQDALCLDRVYIQAKRYTAGNSIGSGAIRDFFGSLDRHKANKGLFVTTSSFSKAARETAEYLSKRIVLIDGDQLGALMVKQNVGCRVEQMLYIKRLDEDFFDD